MKISEKLKEIKKQLEFIRDDANENDKLAQKLRYQNNEKESQYYSGIAQGLREAALKIDKILIGP